MAYEIAAGDLEWNDKRCSYDVSYKYIKTFHSLQEAENTIKVLKLSNYDHLEITHIAENGKCTPIFIDRK